MHVIKGLYKAKAKAHETIILTGTTLTFHFELQQ